MGFKKRPTIARRSRPIRRQTVTAAVPTTTDSSSVEDDTRDRTEASEPADVAQASAAGELPDDADADEATDIGDDADDERDDVFETSDQLPSGQDEDDDEDDDDDDEGDADGNDSDDSDDGDDGDNGVEEVEADADNDRPDVATTGEVDAAAVRADDGDFDRFASSYRTPRSSWLSPAEDELEEDDDADEVAQPGPASIDEYVDDMDESLSAIVVRLAQIIRAVAPNAQESIRWGMPHYAQSGHLAYIDAKQDHVNLGFFRGDELADHEDARSLLQGAGGKLRHIRLYSVHSIVESQIRSLITAAVALNRDISDL